jgi:uncharacterized membrane protein YfcA
LAVIPDPWFWALAVPAVALAGVSKGGFGGSGAGTAATPMMALAVPPPVAAAIMLPLLCVMDLAGVRAYLGRWDRRVMRIIVPAGLAGTLAGALTFRHLDDNWMRVLVGGIAVGFLAYSLLPRRGMARAPSDATGWFWSGVSGFTSFVTHSGTPPLMVYLLPLRLEKSAFAATSLVFFASLNYAKIIPYLWLGLFDARNLATSVALVPAGLAGIYFGLWLQKRIPPLWFFRIIYGVLFVTGSKLLYDGITGLS